MIIIIIIITIKLIKFENNNDHNNDDNCENRAHQFNMMLFTFVSCALPYDTTHVSAWSWGSQSRRVALMLQAVMGTLVKRFLAKRLGLGADQVTF